MTRVSRTLVLRLAAPSSSSAGVARRRFKPKTGPHPRGRCPRCGEDVAVNARGRVMAHGRTRVRNAASAPTWTTTYGCRGWGEEALCVDTTS